MVISKFWNLRKKYYNKQSSKNMLNKILAKHGNYILRIKYNKTLSNIIMHQTKKLMEKEKKEEK